MRNRTARRLVSGLLLGSLALSGCEGPGPSSQDDGPGRSASSQKPALAADLVGLFGELPKESQASNPRRIYELDLRATLSPSAPQGSIPENALSGSQLHVVGTWTATLLGHEEGATVALAQLDVRELEVTAPPSAIVSEEEYRSRMRRELSRPILFKQNERGHVVGVKSEPRMMAAALAVARSVVAAVQTSRPSVLEKEWLGDEHDGGGRFRASYRRAGDHSFTKQKLEYLEVDSGEGLRPPRPDEFRVLASRAKLTTAKSGALTALDSEEQLAVDPGPGLPPLTSKTSCRLTFKQEDVASVPEAKVALLRALDWRPLHQQPPQEAHEFELDLTKAGNYASVAHVLAELGRLNVKQKPADSETQKRLQIALGALFRLKPAAVEEAKALLPKHAAQRDVLLRALATSGNEEAQRLVLAFLLEPESPLTGRARGEVLANVSLARNPTRALVEGLERLLKDPVLSGQALLGLGSAAFRLKTQDPPLSRHALGILSQELEQATEQGSFKRATLVLKAFGNAGHPDMVGLLQPYLTANQHQVRAAAIAALRRVDSADVDKLLEAYLTSDTSDDVKKAARRTLDDRKQRKLGNSDAG